MTTENISAVEQLRLAAPVPTLGSKAWLANVLEAAGNDYLLVLDRYLPPPGQLPTQPTDVLKELYKTGLIYSRENKVPDLLHRRGFRLDEDDAAELFRELLDRPEEDDRRRVRHPQAMNWLLNHYSLTELDLVSYGAAEDNRVLLTVVRLVLWEKQPHRLMLQRLLAQLNPEQLSGRDWADIVRVFPLSGQLPLLRSEWVPVPVRTLLARQRRLVMGGLTIVLSPDLIHYLVAAL